MTQTGTEFDEAPGTREPDYITDDDVQDVDEPAEIQPYKYAITSFGADFPVDGLVQRLQRGDILVPSFDPEFEAAGGVVGFQRGFIWTRTQMDRFVESLLLGLPVPGVFLSSQPNNQFLVLDGQQRLRTLMDYYGGVTGGREYRLDGVQPQFVGLRYKDLDVEDRRRLDNAIVHATIVRQDQPTDDQSSIYMIFERLNTGGTALQPQEIRVALFRGPLVNLLRDLNRNDAWRQLYGPPSKRLKDQELILRFLAFLFTDEEYARPMKEFLNGYMGRNRNLSVQSADELTAAFVPTCTVLARDIGPHVFRPLGPVNAAVVDSVMNGIALRLRQGPVEDGAGLRRAYDALLGDPKYLVAVSYSTAAEDTVSARLRLAREAFAGCT